MGSDQHYLCLTLLSQYVVILQYFLTRLEKPVKEILNFGYIDGGWSEWLPFEACSVTCGGGGTLNRGRLCNNPTPQNGGNDCEGIAVDTVACNDEPCSGGDPDSIY